MGVNQLSLDLFEQTDALIKFFFMQTMLRNTGCGVGHRPQSPEPTAHF